MPDTPNIVAITADDVGIWNLSCCHRGMMGGSTPNIDRIAGDGAVFADYYAQTPALRGGQRSSPARLPSAPGC